MLRILKLGLSMITSFVISQMVSSADNEKTMIRRDCVTREPI